MNKIEKSNGRFVGYHKYKKIGNNQQKRTVKHTFVDVWTDTTATTINNSIFTTIATITTISLIQFNSLY